MKDVSSLPTIEEINAMPIDQLAQKVNELTSPDVNICGSAAFRVNEFLSWSAVRFAREYA